MALIFFMHPLKLRCLTFFSALLLNNFMSLACVGGERDFFIEAFLEIPDVKELGLLTHSPLDFDADSAAATVGLYRVTKTKKDENFILKHLNPVAAEEETSNLRDVKKYFNGHPLLEPAPKILLPLLMGDTQDTRGIQYSYVLLPEAPGKSFEVLWDEYLSGQKGQADMTTCFYALGRSLASLHIQGSSTSEGTSLKKLKTRHLHTDLHEDNIFEDKGIIYFIDNEGFSDSIKNPDSVESDLKTILFGTVKIFLALKPLPTKDISKNHDEISQVIQSFIQGYREPLKNIDHFSFFKEILNSAFDESAKSLQEENSTFSSSVTREDLISELLNPPTEALSHLAS